MAMSCRYAARSCARQLRAAPSAQTMRVAVSSRRWNSTEAAATNPKINTIVDQISQLTLLETADLVSTLKTKLNIPDLPVGGFAAAPAAAPVEEAEEAAPAAQEKHLFTVKLQGFETASKAKVIKEVKSLLGLSLVDSKKFVESAPKLMKENVTKEDAEKMIATMKELGATVVME
ncbi:large subunit ribosomal protein L7/L12 [Emericellopsis cladophorae]|uniref:Large subunit ribosomal protein L7/L12 n=1 Tax=Emericellopsis cladophorae TaxID=2686198 RepID=A0A9P9Y014_9HYPO|nr:large subunit ribosomal protein L7/L12 [Emericellopsis cladophorae]KAI6781078.1 large subunit ribosomal protein L7/L12 [Emericellopsis cladophorae]